MSNSIGVRLAAEDFLRDIAALQGKMRMAHRHVSAYEGEIARTLEHMRKLHAEGRKFQIALYQKRLEHQREYVRTYEYVAKVTLEAIMLRKRALYEIGWKG